MNDSYQHVLIEDQAQWRAWLDANHGTSPGIWLVTWKKASGRPSVPYDVIVDEALAYGWVDSRPRRIDEHRSARLLTPRKPASNWSARNKARVEQLTADGRMHPAGIAAVAAARANGAWANWSRPAPIAISGTFGPGAVALPCKSWTVPDPPSDPEEIMPTVSESLAKLSASMAELAQRAKEAEEHTAAARDETREQLEARAAQARAAAQRRREEMKARGAKVKDELASAWASLRAHVQEQFEKIRARLEEKRDDLDAKAAERRAERAESNAADAIDFASYAVDEAEAAALEAAEARKIADGLHPGAPSPKGEE